MYNKIPTLNNTMKHLKLSGFLILVGCLFACGQKNQNITTSDWKSIDEKTYSIKYPQDWQLDHSDQMGKSFVILSRQTSENDLFRENINLYIQDLQEYNISGLDQFVAVSEAQIKKLLANSKIIKSQRINEEGKKYHQIIYSAEQNNRDLTFEQYYMVKDGKAYILTLTSETDQFANYKKMGETIMNSFILK